VKSLFWTFLLLGLSVPAFADTITMKDGRKIEGGILFHNDAEYYVSTADGVKTAAIADVARIDFDPKDPARDGERSE
jgi:hypothetical protein